MPEGTRFRISPQLSARLDAWALKIHEATGDAKLAAMFGSCMRSTLEDTLNLEPDGSTFVITGDIPAMWLRDSSAQMRPFLHLLREPGLREAAGQVEPALADAIAGLVRRQFSCIARDSYANAFNREANGNCWEPGDTNNDPWVYEQKYEVDSLAFPVQLAHQFWTLTGRTDFLDGTAHAGLRTIVEQWTAEQHHEDSAYRFERPTTIPTETLPREGRGTPVGYTGMTWSGFRPSDDACSYGYNIPANLFAALALAHISELATEVFDDAGLAERAVRLRQEILGGVAEFGVVEHPEHGRIYAYEVDGLGNQLLMDDANMPSLASLPLTSGVDRDDPLYKATRAFVHSSGNPFYFEGEAAAGIGSPHTPPDYIWHIGLAVRGLGSTDRDEQLLLLRLLRDTDAGTGRMHEGFHKDDPTRFTRSWFSWADSMLCELLMVYAGGGDTPR